MMMMMKKKSPLHPKYESSYYDSYGFDLQEDFSQFLEEARQHEMITEAKMKSSSVYPEEEEEGRKEGSSSETEKEKEKKKKMKKAWKFGSVVSWWKAEKKSNLRVGPTNTTMNPFEEAKGKKKKSHTHVSGPIYDNIESCGKGPYNVKKKKKQWRSNSGPLMITSLFKSSRRSEEENEIPYMSLHHHHHQQNSPQSVHNNYGPLYIVT